MMNILKIFSKKASADFDYRSWIQAAELELAVKQAALETEVGLGTWARWNTDLARGQLTFSDEERERVTADVQIVGTVGRADWRWAWANQHLPAAYVRDSYAAKTFGETHRIQELASESVAGDDLEALGWRFTAAAARIVDAAGAYKAPTASGAVFLLIKSIELA